MRERHGHTHANDDLLVGVAALQLVLLAAELSVGVLSPSVPLLLQLRQPPSLGRQQFVPSHGVQLLNIYKHNK